MKNYFVKYSSYFILIGVSLLVMYFLGFVPRRLENVPETSRWFVPLIFIIVGIASKFISSDYENEKKERTELKDSNIPDSQTRQTTTFNQNREEPMNQILTPSDWLNQNPGKSLNDYYAYRNKINK